MAPSVPGSQSRSSLARSSDLPAPPVPGLQGQPYLVRPLDRAPLALELGAGCAELSHAMCRRGLKGVGVDWKYNKHAPVIPILRVDLTTAIGQDLIFRIFQQGRVRFVHCAPPCGTMSRAREIPLPKL